MNSKRWIALIAAVGLLFVSMITHVASMAFSSNFDDLFSMEEQTWSEIIEEHGDSTGKIAVLDVNGVIQDTGDSVSIFDVAGYRHRSFLSMLEHAGQDPLVDGILIRVNTPGGGVVESAEIHDKITEIQEEYEKPIYVSMGSMAASGGYYIAAPADKIIAHPSTITGSIGVIMQSINVAELAENIGIQEQVIKSGAHKDIMSMTREMTETEREIMQEMIEEVFDDFVEVIVQGRNMSETEVRRLGDGRIYTGKQALAEDLVDALGTRDDAIDMLMDDIGRGRLDVIRYEQSIGFNQLFGMTAQRFLSRNDDLLGINELMNRSNSPTLMYLYTR
ncbi:signal peptide peptidase SppA [Bacillus alkalicellulosilyticus]|uniref:signal peptide peptidase SppA n=1 Tax=Alkalihalobacterium alkalicellulosilyticum TaxID=1912214 RepID=UPI0009977D48|nr:signal peptide peptidase SppA [Bacillus alkalicellulosilyticus]